MSVDLVVDVDGLYTLAGELTGLRQEFEAAGDRVDDLGLQDPWLPDALHQFAANWSVKRHEIGEMIEEVAVCVENSGRVYEESDRHMAVNFSAEDHRA